MYAFRKSRWTIIIMLFATLLLSGCNDLIIKDDGQVTLGLENCEGVTFTILVAQSGRHATNNVQVEDGELEFDIGDLDFDFDQNITVEVMAVGQGAEECGIDGVLVFNGKAESIGGGDYKISLGDFEKRE